MSSILIHSQDKNCNLEKIILWNHAFAETCEYIFYPLLRRFENTLFVNLNNVTIVQKKGSRYRLSKGQIYNPVYSIYYQNILFAEIFCEVGGFETYYQIIYNTSFTDCKIFVKVVELFSKIVPLFILKIVFSF
jgi:hypothetical protein